MMGAELVPVRSPQLEEWARAEAELAAMRRELLYLLTLTLATAVVVLTGRALARGSR